MTKIRMLILVILLGLIVIALPDSGNRIFSLGKDHGPSIQDAIGLILMLVPYTWLLIETWRRKNKILKYQDSFIFKLGIFLSGLGYGLIIASVISNYQYWWIFGIILLIFVHIGIFYLTFWKKTAMK